MHLLGAEVKYITFCIFHRHIMLKNLIKSNVSWQQVLLISTIMCVNYCSHKLILQYYILIKPLLTYHLHPPSFYSAKVRIFPKLV